MVRVKINQKQADAIERLKKEQRKKIEEVKANSGLYLANWEKPLFQLDTDDIQNALFEGYEVEPEFYVGDWVNHRLQGLGKVIEVNKNTLEIYRYPGDEEGAYVWHKKNVRHATKQEAWWANHGRDVWELKEDDILEYLGDLYIVDCFNSEEVSLKSGVERKTNYAEPFDYVKKHFEVVCFAEDRKDVDNE